jgi:hypothetical protein
MKPNPGSVWDCWQECPCDLLCDFARRGDLDCRYHAPERKIESRMTSGFVYRFEHFFGTSCIRGSVHQVEVAIKVSRRESGIPVAKEEWIPSYQMGEFPWQRRLIPLA